MHDIRPIALQDVQAAGAMLGRAFCDNPAYRAILPHLSAPARARVVSRVKELYRSVGFEVLSEDDVAGVHGMHLWRMRRPPRQLMGPWSTTSPQ